MGKFGEVLRVGLIARFARASVHDIAQSQENRSGENEHLSLERCYATKISGGTERMSQVQVSMEAMIEEPSSWRSL